jgi:hypothetical protein
LPIGIDVFEKGESFAFSAVHFFMYDLNVFENEYPKRKSSQKTSPE